MKSRYVDMNDKTSKYECISTQGLETNPLIFSTID